ncbi:MAG: G/U mismatch-specific DNA glycosylase [Gemmatimonadota bacterium]
MPKTPAKKTPAKKTPAKKTPAKKTPAKKTPAKKTPGKKTPGEEARGRRAGASRPHTFSRAELEAARTRTVPDLVGPGLRLLFCGINPGLWTAASGAHFAHPGNRFYKALHAAGITRDLLDVRAGFDAASRAALVDKGIGITNLVMRTTARADELDPDEFRKGAERLTRKVRRLRPRVLAFVGLGAYRTGFGRPTARVGEQDHRIGETAIWALPNPSGLNAHYGLEALAELYGQVAQAAGVALQASRR